MATDETYTLSFKRGDTFKRDIKLTDPNNDDAAIPITGWTIKAQLRYGGLLAAELEVIITDDVEGEFTLRLLPAVTEELDPRTYKCDVEFVMLDTSKVSSQTFNVVVEEDVTSA